jgi:hypothetical protein
MFAKRFWVNLSGVRFFGRPPRHAAAPLQQHDPARSQLPGVVAEPKADRRQQQLHGDCEQDRLEALMLTVQGSRALS